MILHLPNEEKINITRAVIKLGTKQITDLECINHKNISGIVKEIMELKEKGIDFILTTSGAIGLGIHEIYKNKNPIEKLSLAQKQALAGLGQIKLMQIFRDEFAKYNQAIGQVLLTHYIFDNRTSFLNAKNTLNTMLEMDILPIINENDSVAVEEIKVGDNDRLGAYVSLLVDASIYIMLSDIDGFYKNYNTKEAQFIRVVNNIQQVIKYACKQKENYTKGGMITKIEAAKITTLSGIPAVIANGFKENIIKKVFNDLSEGTIFLPSNKNLSHKKRWISVKKTKGKIIIDDGAKNAILQHKSLLASGIKRVEGNFKYGDTVVITDLIGNELAVGLSNYSSREIQLIAGRKSSEIEFILGKENKYSCVIHIDNMVLTNRN